MDGKIPITIQCYETGSCRKLRLSRGLNLGIIISFIRKTNKIDSERAIFLTSYNDKILPLHLEISLVYDMYKKDDNLLVLYREENVFG